MFDVSEVDRLKKKLGKAKNANISFIEEIDAAMMNLPQQQKEKGAFENKVNESSINNSRSSKERST